MTFEEAFYWAAAWYNGCGDEFDSVIRYLRIQRSNPNFKGHLINGERKTISKPEFIKSDGSTPVLELFWMILVEMYGDYGTSPRSGWMYVDELDECLNHLSEIRRKTWASEFEDDV